MIQIALDAMGGDNAPSATVEGAIEAAKVSEGRYKIVLTGPEEILKAELAKHNYTGDEISIQHAPQQVAMDDSPSDVLKTKQDSGLVTCVGLQKKGLVQASVSAGNSGAMMAACLMLLGRTGKISRPAIACGVPSIKRPVVLLDCGANVDEKPLHLLHFAICGSTYAEHVLKYENPRVGLLNIGEEEKKGPEVIQETHQILKKAPINFIGNIESRDIVKGDVDVVVAPGYAGNIVLKLMEGFYEYHKALFGVIDSPEGEIFEKGWNYSNIGAGLLLGLNGTGLITHGRADAPTIKMAILNAYNQAVNEVSVKISQKLEELA